MAFYIAKFFNIPRTRQSPFVIEMRADTRDKYLRYSRMRENPALGEMYT